MFILSIGVTFVNAITAPPLDNLPSAPGVHISQIEAMGDNQWLKLPKTTIDQDCPSWGGESYGRSWTPKYCYAPELGGAFITGEGSHYSAQLGVQSGGYGGDDIWFYDLYANKWINIYTGTRLSTFAQNLTDKIYKIDTNGIMRDSTGSAIPVVPLGGHGGWTMDYDKANHKFAWIGTTVGGQYQPEEVLTAYMSAMASSGLTWWTSTTNHDYANPHRHGMWTYDVATGKFDFLYQGTAAPDRYSATDLYVDSKKMIMRPGATKEWWYDMATGSITSKALKGTAPQAANTYGACYDPKRNCVYVFGSPILNQTAAEPAANNFYLFDVATETWSKPMPENSPMIRIDNGRFMMEYDSVSDRCLIMYIKQQPISQGQRFIHAYDPNTNSFETALPVSAQQLPEGFAHSFFCPDLDAYFIFCAYGDNYKGDHYVYRYKSPSTIAKEKAMRGVSLFADKSEIELYLGAQLKYALLNLSGVNDTITNFLFCRLFSLDPTVATVSADGAVTAKSVGTARFVLRRNGFMDTLSIHVGASTATLDSIVLWPTMIKRMVADPCTVIATGYYHKDSESFFRRIDSLVTWNSSIDSVTGPITFGTMTLKKAGGPVSVTASLGGKTSNSCQITVWPRPSFIKRINFQYAAEPWKVGWLADNGGLYSVVKGYGWVTAPQLMRSDRNGTNFLLKSLVSTNYTSKKVIDYKVTCPDGSYIIKYGVGDNLSSTSADTVWQGGKLLFAHYGAVNGIKIDTVIVTGGNGLVLTVCGAMNYLVMIANEGIDINLVADDDGVVVTPPATALEDEITGTTETTIKVSPNPFNPTTTIQLLGVRHNGNAQVSIYDVRGILVEQRTLKLSKLRDGYSWDGARHGSGVYTLRVAGTGFAMTRQLICIK
ncbi:MAG: T9SS type A sorting domain-containing protein [Fibrobacteres bacterium]|nr:T9SS type A sorting domain-containing protein [Fibrobacterota bacterium]